MNKYPKLHYLFVPLCTVHCTVYTHSTQCVPTRIRTIEFDKINKKLSIHSRIIRTYSYFNAYLLFRKYTRHLFIHLFFFWSSRRDPLSYRTNFFFTIPDVFANRSILFVLLFGEQVNLRDVSPTSIHVSYT